MTSHSVCQQQIKSTTTKLSSWWQTYFQLACGLGNDRSEMKKFERKLKTVKHMKKICLGSDIQAWLMNTMCFLKQKMRKACDDGRKKTQTAALNQTSWMELQPEGKTHFISAAKRKCTKWATAHKCGWTGRISCVKGKEKTYIESPEDVLPCLFLYFVCLNKSNQYQTIGPSVKSVVISAKMEPKYKFPFFLFKSYTGTSSLRREKGWRYLVPWAIMAHLNHHK